MAQAKDAGPFYHGTKVKLSVGDELTAGFRSNYQPDIVMNHVYFTSLLGGAAYAAAFVSPDRRGYVYRVEPMGAWEDDPNVTDKKFPGNPTKSYRSAFPLKIVEEIFDFQTPSKEQIEKRVEGLAKLKMRGKAEIMN